MNEKIKDREQIRDLSFSAIKDFCTQISDPQTPITVSLIDNPKSTSPWDYEIQVAADVSNYGRMIGASAKTARAIQEILKNLYGLTGVNMWYRVLKTGNGDKNNIVRDLEFQGDPEFKNESAVTQFLKDVLTVSTVDFNIVFVKNSGVFTKYTVRVDLESVARRSDIHSSLSVIMAAIGKVNGREISIEIV